MKRGISVFLLSVSFGYAAIGEQAATAVAPPDAAPAFTGPCAYSDDVLARPRLRGVMSPGRDMNEDDFKTLGEWGATLLRYQMVRDWHGVGTNQDLEEFDRWLDGKLDHVEGLVLPMARKYGISVALDLHVTPGGRDASHETAMFHDVHFAEHFLECWRRIARRFRSADGLYGYDLVNEPQQQRAGSPNKRPVPKVAKAYCVDH